MICGLLVFTPRCWSAQNRDSEMPHSVVSGCTAVITDDYYLLIIKHVKSSLIAKHHASCPIHITVAILVPLLHQNTTNPCTSAGNRSNCGKPFICPSSLSVVAQKLVIHNNIRGYLYCCPRYRSIDLIAFESKSIGKN